MTGQHINSVQGIRRSVVELSFVAIPEEHRLHPGVLALNNTLKERLLVIFHMIVEVRVFPNPKHVGVIRFPQSVKSHSSPPSTINEFEHKGHHKIDRRIHQSLLKRLENKGNESPCFKRANVIQP